MFLVLALLLASSPPTDTYEVQATLQGLYDEISQTLLQLSSDSDVDQLHDVLYTPDCVFVDASGKQHPWADMREQMLRMTKADHVSEMVQRIQRVSLTPKGATVIVQASTLHPVAKDGASSDAKDATLVTDATTYRDTWVQTAGAWRLQSRTQVGGPTRRGAESMP